MASHLTRIRVALVVAVLALSAVVVCPTHSAGQTPAITADGTLGTAVSQSGNAYSINGGTIKGTNLFHSFGRFNVPTGGSATFTGPSSTTNILSRVTGGGASTIDGLISTRASMPNANFFLINPSGVVFTAGASLDVGGAVRVASANNIMLADGALFSATPVPGEFGLLSSAPPQAFGFLGAAPAGISVEAAQLVVDPGQTLSLVGGDVQIRGGVLAARGGLVQIGSVASPGNADLSAPDLKLTSFPGLGQVSISEGAFVTADSDGIMPSGTVVIRSGRLLVDNAVLSADTFDSPGASLGIDLRATESIVLRNFATVRTESFGMGDAPGISIVTASLAVTEEAILQSLAFLEGDTGGIAIEVQQADVINGTIRTSSLASTAGDITITADDSVTVSGPTGQISSGTFNTFDVGTLGGDISLVVGKNLILRDQAGIRSGSIVEQGGQNLTISAGESVLISGLAGISSQAFSADVGVVDISTPRLSIDGGFINASALGVGNAGTVLITAHTVDLRGGGQIASSGLFLATGAGGIIRINAAGSVTITGVGPDDGVESITLTRSPSSGLFSTASESFAAEAQGGGQIIVSTPLLTISDGGKVSAFTPGAGPAGGITLNVGTLTLSGGGGLFSNVSKINPEAADPSGPGGDITIDAAKVQLLSGGTISASSLGTATATAGNITIIAGELVRMENSSITTESLLAGRGIISIATTGSLVHLTDSQIATSVRSGEGRAGDITIDSELIALDGTRIRADAFGGPGGNITIVADVYLTQDSLVSASSALSTPGTINIQASITDVSGTLAQLPAAVLEAAALLRASCAARLAGGKTSTLVVAGREGLPLEPGGLLPSPLVTAGQAGAGLSGSDGRQWETLAAERYSLVPPSAVLDRWCSR